MKLAFYLSSFPALSETFIHRQVASMMKRGHDVTIIAARRAPSAPVHETVSRHHMLDRAVFLDGSDGNGILKALQGAALWPLRNPAGFVSSVVRGAGSMSPKSLARDLRTWAALRGARFDAVLAHFGPTALDAQALCDAGILHGPVIPVFHGYDITRYVRQNGKGVYSTLFEKAPMCLAISDRWAARLEELGCPKSKIAVNRVGLETEGIGFTPRSGVGSRLRALSVARLVEKKGLAHAIGAVSIARRYVPLSYAIVGDGPLLPELRDLAAEMGVGDIVTFLGPLPEQEVRSRMASSDLLLVPSVVASDGDEEGIPVVIMEAMASGLPVIASRHSGIPELVRHGETGFLVPEGDWNALAEAIRDISGNPPSPDMLKRARSRVEELHSADRLAEEIETLLVGL